MEIVVVVVVITSCCCSFSHTAIWMTQNASEYVVIIHKPLISRAGSNRPKKPLLMLSFCY